MAELATRQHGVVSLAQLVHLGYTRQQVRTLMAKGVLLATGRRGVFFVGHVRHDRHALWMAACLAVGPDALLSHTSAATLAGLRRDPIEPVHLTAVRSSAGRRRGIVLHRAVEIDRADRVVHQGLPMTSIGLTLIDVAGLLGPGELARTVERTPRLDTTTMRRTLDRHERRSGSARLRALVDVYDDHTRSLLERRFLAVCRAAEVDRPQVNRVIEGRERDFAWPDQRLVIECDGHAFHSSRAQRNRDARRDIELGRASWRVHRFTYEHVVLDPAGAAADVRALLGR